MLIYAKLIAVLHSERITATEYGARRPIAPSDSEEGNMLNRRVYAIASEPQE